MTDSVPTLPETLVDEYGNRHRLREVVASGGQGAVFRTSDNDLAIKVRTKGGTVETTRRLLENLRCLPIPSGLPISLPHAVLRDQPGYVMPLLSGMEDFSRFFPPVGFASGTELISWYISSGATKSRLFALAQSAAILARLHAAGIVYGDLSPRNVFIRADRSAEVWLIDCDNLKFETAPSDGFYTELFEAPEIRDSGIRPRTDAWSFAVMAFWMLSCLHPLVDGKEFDWMNPHASPFVDDEDDDSNRATKQGKPLGLPRELVLTPRLIRLFQAALGKGRRSPWHRPSLGYWALELARAHDLLIVCQKCRWSYGVEEPCCPLCDAAKPNHVLAESRYWKMVLQETEFVVNIPHRLIRPFSLRMTDPTEYEIEIDADRSRVVAARGSSPIPKGLDFRFVGEKK